MSSSHHHPLNADREENWLDKAIETARERGEFDNLPGQGKRIDLGPESSAPVEYDLAFTMLANAGYVPLFVDLAKELDALELDLVTMRNAAVEEIDRLLDELDKLEATTDARSVAPRPSRWQRFWKGSGDVELREPMTRDVVEQRRRVLRDRHGDLADRLDANTTEYHAAIPRELWHLQRHRKSRQEWDAIFDAACPHVNFR